MSSNNQQSPLDQHPWFDIIHDMLEVDGETNAGATRRLEEEHDLQTSKDSIRRFRARHNIRMPEMNTNKARVTIKEDEAEVTTAASTDFSLDRLNNPDEMLTERGLDPEEWVIAGATVNEWEGPTKNGVKLFKQAKLNLKRRVEGVGGILPARSEGWSPARLPPETLVEIPGQERDYQQFVLVGDQQAPFNDTKLHELFLRWLKQNRPDGGILIGDTIDLPDLSRHRDNPDNVATANECIQAGYELLRDYVAASPRTSWIKIPGNHDERLRNYLIDKAPRVSTLNRAIRDEVEPLEKIGDVSFWMRLDELGINFADPYGQYTQAKVDIGTSLTVKHGSVVKRQSGASALATLEGTGYNVVVGHTHRQGIVFKTDHDISGVPTTNYGVEAGCMCSISGSRSDGRRFPDYTENPNWQQGFAVATVYSDGSTNIELATYRNGSLYFRNQRYS